MAERDALAIEAAEWRLLQESIVENLRHEIEEQRALLAELRKRNDAQLGGLKALLEATMRKQKGYSFLFISKPQ